MRDGLGDTICEIVPLDCSEVVASRRRPCLRLTSTNFLRKSALMMGVLMSAMMNTQRNTHRSPRSRVRDRVPYVVMGEPLTALSPRSCLCFRSAPVGGSTLTSAPVSTRKRQLEVLSFKSNRRLGKWPATLVAENEWPNLFLPTCMGAAFGGLVAKLPVVVAQANRFLLVPGG